MRLVYSVVLVTCCLVVLQLSSQTPRKASVAKTATPSNLEKQLREADLEFCRQTAARGLDGWMDSFADDAAIVQNGKTVSGKEALRKHYAPMFATEDFTLTWTPTHAEASKDGSLGYTYGEYEARTGTGASRGMYVTIWRRVNRKWKVVMDTGSALRQQQQ